MIRDASFTFHFVAHEADDVPGMWVAHCLDLDVVIQGDSFLDAMDSLFEAVDLALNEGAPNGYKRAPDQYWQTCVRVMQKGERVEMFNVSARTPPRMRAVTVAGCLTVPKQPQRMVMWIESPSSWATS